MKQQSVVYLPQNEETPQTQHTELQTKPMDEEETIHIRVLIPYSEV